MRRSVSLLSGTPKKLGDKNLNWKISVYKNLPGTFTFCQFFWVKIIIDLNIPVISTMNCLKINGDGITFPLSESFTVTLFFFLQPLHLMQSLGDCRSHTRW